MILRINESKRGAFGTVLIDRANLRVYKLFKSNRHPDYIGDDSFADERNKMVFKSEIEAYKIAGANPLLKRHTPEYFGEPQIDKILDQRENNISHLYLLDCCYCIGLCEGNEQKLGQCVQQHLTHFAERLKQQGVRYVIDCSVFKPESEKCFKFIDFATHDAVTLYYSTIELA
jgi:hypothetical protein